MGGFSIFGGSKAPDPPDYAGAAQATAKGDLENARYSTLANRPDIYTPEGSRTWQQGTGEVFDQAGYDQAMQTYQTGLAAPPRTYVPGGGGSDGDPEFSGYYTGGQPSNLTAPNRADFTTMNDPDKWTGTTTLNPEAQKAFESNQRMQTGLANLGEGAVGQIGEMFSTPFNIDGQSQAYQGPEGDMPTYGENRGNVVNAMMSRVNTDIGRDRERVNAKLIAQGIPVGSEAYNRQMEQLDRKQTDARQQAEISAEGMAGQAYSSALAGRNVQNQEGMADFTTGLDTRRQDIQESLLNRQTPLNEISAFRTGSQVGMPQFQAYGNQQFTGGPEYAGAAAAQGQYDIGKSNQDIAEKNALYNGMFSLGSAGIGAFPFG